MLNALIRTWQILIHNNHTDIMYMVMTTIFFIFRVFYYCNNCHKNVKAEQIQKCSCDGNYLCLKFITRRLLVGRRQTQLCFKRIKCQVFVCTSLSSTFYQLFIFAETGIQRCQSIVSHATVNGEYVF